MSWKPEVETVNEPGKFYGNALRFATFLEALANAQNLAERWTLVTDFRAVESTDPVNYVWTINGLKAIEEAQS